ncbi:MAG TPA: protein kinase [Pyrinomonadaceae bacterium]|nr:protein kinase [Pyrinomonadaceae bacterium]
MEQQLEANSTLSHYRIVSKLGAGGMGEVYLAQDTKLDRKVALKVLPADVAADRMRMRRFVQEAKAASALNHPNIITIHEIEQLDSLNFIATEFIDGETLRQRMRRAPMKPGEVIEVVIQCASALSAAHATGIVHRDIKPENIMIRLDGIVKVLDFGLAKLIETRQVGIDAEAPTSFKTDPGTVVGTAIYMSPEQARGAEMDARTDIFSLGVLIYEMVAGRLPFEGSSTNEIMASILNDREATPLARYTSEVPAELQRIVAKALRKNRDERYQTTKDLLLDLQSLKHELEFERKFERSAPPNPKSAALMREHSANQTVADSVARPTVTARGVTSALRLNLSRTAIPVALILIIGVAIAMYFYFSRSRQGPINSIAVLPFVNASGNSDLEYLSDGITDSLIYSLSQVPNLSVKARSSVFRYKGKDVEPQQVGNELSVQAVLNGRVIQLGDQLTISLGLVDARTGNQVWGEQYNRKLADLVALQGEIARDVSSELRVRLSSAEAQKVARNYTSNTQAYQLYLKGRYQIVKMKPTEVEAGISYFRRAIEVDPLYALAYVGLADAYRAQVLSSGEKPASDFFAQAKAAAKKAIEIDDALAEAHGTLGFIIFWSDWDWYAAEKECKRALELSPNVAEAHVSYAHVLLITGRTLESLAEMKRARELEPINSRLQALEAQFLLYAEKKDEALVSLKNSFELDPNFWFSHNFAAAAYTDKEMYAEACVEARKAHELSQSSTLPPAYLGYALAKSGKRKEALAVLDEVLRLSHERYVPPYHIALIYAGLGDKDETMNWLERGYEQRDPKMVFLKVEPKWHELRDDPRFQALMKKVGLP